MKLFHSKIKSEENKKGLEEEFDLLKDEVSSFFESTKTITNELNKDIEKILMELGSVTFFVYSL